MPAIAPSSIASRPLGLAGLAALAVGGAVVAATLALWAYHGTTVFFEMVQAGWMACF